MSNLNDFNENLRQSIMKKEDMIQDTEKSVDLHLSKEQFMEKMQKEPDGWELMDLLEIGESAICERMGLIKGYSKDGTVCFDVPRWNNLLAHLRIVNSI